jgi:hypothetical protein
MCAPRPAKVTGQDHPDVIVETATLASVEPPNPTYSVHKGVQVRRLGPQQLSSPWLTCGTGVLCQVALHLGTWHAAAKLPAAVVVGPDSP